MKEVWKKSVIPVYAIALVWALYALLFPLYRLWDFLIAAAVSVVAYMVASKVFPGEKILVEVEPPKSGNPEVDEIIAQGHASLKRMRQANAAIEDAALSAQIQRLETVSTKIFEYVRENPKKAPQIRKFMNYYLPTTLKLLDAYDQLDSQGVQGKNIQDTLRSIENVMGTIVTAFEKQLDHLFADQALDISTDITVLEGMMAQEGLLEQHDFQSVK